jgi:hypothetical protein
LIHSAATSALIAPNAPNAPTIDLIVLNVGVEVGSAATIVEVEVEEAEEGVEILNADPHDGVRDLRRKSSHEILRD